METKKTITFESREQVIRLFNSWALNRPWKYPVMVAESAMRHNGCDRGSWILAEHIILEDYLNAKTFQDYGTIRKSRVTERAIEEVLEEAIFFKACLEHKELWK